MRKVAVVLSIVAVCGFAQSGYSAVNERELQKSIQNQKENTSRALQVIQDLQNPNNASTKDGSETDFDPGSQRDVERLLSLSFQELLIYHKIVSPNDTAFRIQQIHNLFSQVGITETTKHDMIIPSLTNVNCSDDACRVATLQAVGSGFSAQTLPDSFGEFYDRAGHFCEGSKGCLIEAVNQLNKGIVPGVDQPTTAAVVAMSALARKSTNKEVLAVANGYIEPLKATGTRDVQARANAHFKLLPSQ